MSYESWRISYQSSEQAARAAFDEIATLRAQLAASEARAERLESALTPRKWTKQQAHVWHCTIPDVDMAFEALRITALAEGEGE